MKKNIEIDVPEGFEIDDVNVKLKKTAPTPTKKEKETVKSSHDCIDKYKADWDAISLSRKKCSDEFLDEYKNYFNWDHVIETQVLSESFIRNHQYLINWTYFFDLQICDRVKSLTNQVLLENFFKIDIKLFSDEVIKSYPIIGPHYSELNESIELFEKTPYITIEEIERIVSTVDPVKKSYTSICWGYLSRRRKLDDKVIDKFNQYLDWNALTRSQNLSEEIINKYSERINWNFISNSGCVRLLPDSFI